MQEHGFVTAALWQPARVAELCAWAIARDVAAPYATLVLHHLPAGPARAPASAAPSRPSTLAELTRREQEVIQLAAHGLLNEDIAQQLHLSVRTVRNHLQCCYAKLGVRSRAEALQKVGN